MEVWKVITLSSPLMETTYLAVEDGPVEDMETITRKNATCLTLKRKHGNFTATCMTKDGKRQQLICQMGSTFLEAIKTVEVHVILQKFNAPNVTRGQLVTLYNLLRFLLWSLPQKISLF